MKIPLRYPVLACAVLGAIAAWHYWPQPLVIEPAAPPVKLSDGSYLPQRSATDPKVKPTMQVPKGAHVERQGQITVQGKSTGDAAKPCAPVDVDYALLRNNDNTRRMQFKALNGDVLGGYDIPVETPRIASAKWAVGVSYDPIHQTPGVWVDRDLGPVRIGAELNQTRIRIGGPTGIEARVKAGWVFE